MSNKPFSRLVNILAGREAEAEGGGLLLGSSFSRLEKFVHYWVLVTRSFIRNRCLVRASALSYTTLLALIPMLAVAMSVTSLFLKSSGQEQIETFIQQFVDRMVPALIVETNAAVAEGAHNEPSSVSGLDLAPAGVTNLFLPAAPAGGPSATGYNAQLAAARKQAASYIHQFIQNTYSGTLGVTGVILLFWTAIVMLTRVEETFNDIWGASRGRDWWSRIAHYCTTLFLGGLLLTIALGLASGPYFQKTRDLISTVPLLAVVTSQLLPVAVIALTFTLLYKLMPNTKVQFSAALVGGLLAGTAWHVFNLISLHLATRAVNASKIYGSLALVPLLMLGLYTVWIIVLFGAQAAYAYQNRESYFQDKLAENVNQRGREFVALRLMTCVGKRFQGGLPPVTIQNITAELGIPSRLVQQILHPLLAARLVTEIAGAEPAYVPARPLEAINAHHVLLALRAASGQEPGHPESVGARLRRVCAHRGSRTAGRVLGHDARAGESGAGTLELAPPADSESEWRLSTENFHAHKRCPGRVPPYFQAKVCGALPMTRLRTQRSEIPNKPFAAGTIASLRLSMLVA